MNTKTELLAKISRRDVKLGVIGLGYVGLPLSVSFAKAGVQVVGMDIDLGKVDRLNSGRSHVEDVPDDELRPLLQNACFRASGDFSELTAVDAIAICLPTPLGESKEPDISFIISATDNIAKYGAAGKLVILESTTYPGTTEEVILPRLIVDGDRVGEDFFLAFSPERIDPGRTDYNMFNTPKVIGGVTSNCLEVALAFYGIVVAQPIPVSSTSTAEMVKLLENTFRAVNIGLVNEVALMCDKLGLDVWEVINAAATKPYGFMPFYPGPGLGGHCIPVDPHYLSWRLRSLNYTARFVELAHEINSYMPKYVVNKVTLALNDASKPVKNSRILVLGVAYKPNIGDVRESPAIDIIGLLEELGAEIAFHDPYVEDLLVGRKTYHTINLTDEALEEADCVVVVTNHASYDWGRIAAKARLIMDTRHAIKNSKKGRIVHL